MPQPQPQPDDPAIEQAASPAATGLAAQPPGPLVAPANDDPSTRNAFVASRAAASNPDPVAALDQAFPREMPEPAGVEGAPRPAAPPPAVPARPLAERVLGGAKAIGSDLLRGVVGLPGEAVGGMLDAVNSSMDFIADATAKLPGPYVQIFNTKGQWDPKVMNAEEGRAAQLQDRLARLEGKGHGFTYNMAEPDSYTGRFLRSLVSFLTTRKALAGNPTSALGNIAADVGAGAVSMPASAPRLSNVIDTYAPNALTDFLKATPQDEGTVLGHLKAGLEMGGLGMAFSGLVRTFRALKGAFTSSPGAAAPAAEGAGATAGIPQQSGLSDAERAVETRFADQLGTNPQAAIERYNALPESQGGRILNTDIARDLSPDYNANLEARSTLSRAVHEPASWLTKRLFATKLAEPVDPDHDTVLFTAGGTGAGKTTAVNRAIANEASDADFVYDTNSNNAESAAKKIDAVLASGRKATIAYVYRDPVDSFRGMLQRAERQGRAVPLADHAATHEQVGPAMQALTERYADDPRVSFVGVDNSAGGGGAKAVPIEDLIAKRYTTQVGEYESEAERAYQAGEISPRVYRGVLGRDPPETAGAGGAVGEGAGGVDQRGLLRSEHELELPHDPDRERPGAAAAGSGADSLGYPPPESGHPLSPPGTTPTVEVSPDLQARFERYMAQERGELGAPLEANERPLAAQRSRDFSATGANPVKVNLNAINGPADLKDAIARVSSQIPAQAVRHNEAVLEAAQAVGMNPDDFLAGPGRALSDSEVVAARIIYNDVAQQVLSRFKLAALPDASADERAAAMAAYAKFDSMTAYMEGAGAESGRSVQAWGIPIPQMSVPYAEAVKRIAATADPMSREFMERMAALDTPEQVASAANAARKMTARDWQLYGWYNALLGPRTVIKKGASDTFMALWNLAVRYTAERFGPEAGVPAGETAALFNGYKGHFADGLALARRAIQAGQSQFHHIAGPQASEFLEAFDHDQALAASAGQLPDSPTLAMRDYLRIAASPKTYLPTTWIGAVDDLATMINYRAELDALTYRAASAKGLAGDEFAQTVAALRANPPTALHKQAVAAAMQNTFKEPLTGAAATLSRFVDQLNIPVGHGTNFELPFGRIIMPFVKIPTNIARWSYTNSPIPALFPSSRVSAELAAGGATRDLALARIGLGTALATSFAGMALSGRITGQGPASPELRRAWMAAGNTPHSLVVGDKQYGYNSLEPTGLLAATIADTYDIMRFAKEEDAGQAALSLVFGAGDALLSKTYLSGISNLFQALENPDAQSGPWFDRLVSSAAIPNVAADLTRAQDPWMRAHYDLLHSIEARLPYLSQGLPPQRTLWGDPIPVKEGYAPFLTGTALARAFSPVSVGPALPAEPIDKWIWENRLAFPRGPDNKLGLSRPGLTQNFSAGPGIAAQVQLTPEQHDRLQVLAGNGLKDNTGMGAKDTLNALVEGHGPGALQSQWDKASPAERALIVQAVATKFRQAAKQQLLNEFPDVRDAVTAGFNARAQALARQ